MLRRPDLNHILRAAASLSGYSRFMTVGTGAIIATAKHIPLIMMMTEEIDIYAEEAADPDEVSDLIDASIGRDSQFHRTFGYYGDGVSERFAVMPLDWRVRATEYTTPDYRRRWIVTRLGVARSPPSLRGVPRHTGRARHFGWFRR
jgi:hypothetical protein